MCAPFIKPWLALTQTRTFSIKRLHFCSETIYQLRWILVSKQDIRSWAEVGSLLAILIHKRGSNPIGFYRMVRCFLSKTLDQTSQYRMTNHWPILLKLWRSSFQFFIFIYLYDWSWCKWTTSSQIPWRPYAFSQKSTNDHWAFFYRFHLVTYINKMGQDILDIK